MRRRLTGVLVLCSLLSVLPMEGAQAATHFEQAQRLILPAVAGGFRLPDKAQAALPAEGWQPVSLPDVGLPRTPDEVGKGQVQTLWYRFVLSEAQRAQPQELYFYLPRWQTVGQVALYGDDRLIWRSHGDVVWNGFNQPVWVPLDPQDHAQRPRALLLRMDSMPGLGGGITSAWVGTEAELAGKYHLRLALQVHLLLATMVAFLALGLFSLAVWWRRRQESLYGLCFIASAFFVARCLHLVTPLDPALLSSAWFGWISVNAMSWLVATILLFNFRYCHRRYPWLERGIISSVALQTLVTVPWLADSEAVAALSSYLYLFILLFTTPASFLAVRAGWQERSGAGLALAAITLLGVPLAVHDLLLQGYRLSLEGVYLMPLSQVTFFLLFAYILHRRYIGSIEGLERSHEVLTQRLQAREAELANSYAKLHAAEQRELLNRERQRLMRDMHDGLGGSLTGALRMMEQGGYEEERLRAALRECVDELRLTIDSLEPVGSDVTVLLASLRFRLQPRLEAAGLALRWRVEALPPLDWLTPGHAMHVMRIVQEVVTNIVKHAQAREIVFSTRVDAAQACICIEDDGLGFDGAVPNAGPGRGLGNIRHRGNALGAVLCWEERGPYTGTRFVLGLPLTRRG
ncbi:sensor histidine kinase [uncultured Rhodoferax sp.]|uniref:sensor histidine kinase n=1 Tax=uncultured Rhodoferax sp. TaxID=223188 RepID=UPI0025FBB417|nr:sensor histidine kinase [uncultured Rhodoferax sp.]